MYLSIGIFHIWLDWGESDAQLVITHRQTWIRLTAFRGTYKSLTTNLVVILTLGGGSYTLTSTMYNQIQPDVDNSPNRLVIIHESGKLKNINNSRRISLTDPHFPGKGHGFLKYGPPP